MLTAASLRLAVVGCGYITQAEHIPALLALQPELAVAATVDVDPVRAAAIGALFHAPNFNSLEAALEATAFDAVLIATPPATHSQLIAVAARAGKHILVEKPVAYALAEAREAIQVVDAAGVTCMVAYHRRYDDDCLKIKRLLQEGALGDVRAAASFCRLAFPSIYRSYAVVRPTPRTNRPQDLPPDWLAENSIHHINLLRFWLGEVTALHSAIYRADDHNLGIVTLSFGDVLASHHQLRGMECGETVSLYGTDATLHVELWYPHRPYAFPKVTLFRTKPHAERTELIQPRTSPYTNEIAHFASLLRGEVENRSTLADSYRDLEVLRDILAQARYVQTG
jgi:predicted dehydrogenase